MSNAINLLRPVDKRLDEKKKKTQLLQTGAFVLLGIVGIFTVLLFIVKNQIPGSVQDEEKLVSSRLQVLSSQSVEFSIVNDRLQNIGIILQKRTDVVKQINLITNTLSSDIKIDSLTLSKKDMKITVSSHSLSSLDTYLAQISKLSTASSVRSVILDSFASEDINGYSVTVEITLI